MSDQEMKELCKCELEIPTWLVVVDILSFVLLCILCWHAIIVSMW